MSCPFCGAKDGTLHAIGCGNADSRWPWTPTDADLSRRHIPDDLLQIATRNVTVGQCVAGWRAGHWSFEQALIKACCLLVEQNDRLIGGVVPQFSGEFRERED